MRAIAFKGWLVLGAAAAILVLVAIAPLCYRQVLEQDADAARLVHNHEVVENFDALETDLAEAETAERGYLLTGDSSHLAAYQAASGRVNSAFRQARQLGAGNPDRERVLGHMGPEIASKLGEWNGAMKLRQGAGTRVASAAAQTGSARQPMDELRAVIGQLKREEHVQLEEEQKSSANASSETKRMIFLGDFLGALFLCATGLVFRAEMAKRSRAETELHLSEERLLMISNVHDYSIYMLDAEGRVLTWNTGAERMEGYRSEEIIGRDYAKFFTPEDRASGVPARKLKTAARDGYEAGEGWRVRKDGSRYWMSNVLTALRNGNGQLRGFGTVTRDLTEQKKSDEESMLRNAQMEAANKELEAFSYSVAHDLRAPLRGIDGFSQALMEDKAEQLDDEGKAYAQRIRAAAQRMGALIDDLLSLSRVTRAEVSRTPTDLSAMARAVAAELRGQQPERNVEWLVAPGLQANVDPRLMRVALENLLGNSWKFTSKREQARIEFGRLEQSGASAFFVRDNGAGFDPAYSSRLFGAFQRLHGVNEFPGTGIGLATVQRIVHRHGGTVWGEGAVGRGATFYFRV